MFLKWARWTSRPPKTTATLGDCELRSLDLPVEGTRTKSVRFKSSDKSG